MEGLVQVLQYSPLTGAGALQSSWIESIDID
jgi:hypothetical protein